MNKNTRITVLMGGPGSEHAVSISSGEGVIKALQDAGFCSVTPLIVTDRQPIIPEGTELCYNMIHGTFGEDGELQSYLEQIKVPYTGAGSACSKRCFDKVLTKRAMQAATVPCPQDEVLTREEVLAGTLPSIPIPCVVKPPKEGSSVGVHIVQEVAKLQDALDDVAGYGEEILIEQYIAGRELTVAILDGEVFPVVQICPRDGFYDMKNKYPSLYSGGAGSDYICPAELSEEERQAVQSAALAAYRALGVEVYGRVDVLLTAEGEPFVLEINTIPGMTSSSLFPKAAAAHGISYAELCERIADISIALPRA